MNKSICCGAAVRSVGDITKYYECVHCKNPCDAILEGLDVKKTTAYNINQTIQKFSKDEILDTEDVSDGYHTFGELYKHRFHLYIALCKTKLRLARQEMDCETKIIRSKIHQDGLNVWEDWGMFLLCIHTDEGQISYHLDKEYWDKCDFAVTEERAKIPFDGHSSDDVLDRLLKI